MASVTLDGITKIYPNGFEAVHDLSVTVNDGEFLVLVGPSGCGKTTALRMVAGLEEISRGTLQIGDRVVNDVSAKERDVAMIFQNYALYPHMTVAENIGFALKLRKMPKHDVEKRVRSAASTLGLTPWLQQKPGQLSGGQRQRVAMGRAIVREPAVFLMDEPLSNLDAKLRVQMRAEVSAVQRRVGVATIYVTHDQTEAMTMGDRVAVIQSGELLQCDNPRTLYDRPKNVSVASFIGSPSINLYEAALSEDAEEVHVGSQSIVLTDAVHAARRRLRSFARSKVIVGARPEDLPILSDRTTGQTFKGTVKMVEALGSDLLLHFETDAEQVSVDKDKNLRDELTPGELAPSARGIARVEPRSQIRVGDQAFFCIDPERLHFFDSASGDAIW